MHAFPLQTAKVQEPSLRDETLTRDRLLDWMRAKIHHRVILVIAEAGYGKTTLLADFSRRSRHRTMWYRLDEGDQSWSGILGYLIAAGREFVPDFAPTTASLLREIGPSGPTREAVVETFMREIGVLADRPGVLIIDDVHLVDHADDVAYILRVLVERLPARMTLVLVSRRPPNLPLARLRGQGEVAELTGADLRFDDTEIERLFRESYRQPLEPDVLREVALRTEGWAASLELVHTALRDRPAAEAREFITELSGSRGDVYDYLAEEIVGELPLEFQRFLMHTAILETLHPDLVAVATGLDASTARRRTEDAERLGLVSRRATRTRAAHRYHPLVREFLETRLRADIGLEAVADLHRAVARSIESRDWAIACRHYAAAGDAADIQRVIEVSISRIMASGAYAQAESLIDRFPVEPAPASFDIVRSRMELRRGSVGSAISFARRATSAMATDAGRMNLASVLFTSGRMEEAAEATAAAIETIEDAGLREISGVIQRLIRTSVDASVADTAAQLQRLAEVQFRAGNTHFAGVAQLNLAVSRMHAGDVQGSLEAASEACGLLLKVGSLVELASAEIALAWALAHSGRVDDARRACLEAGRRVQGRFEIEARAEAAFIEAVHGDVDEAARQLALVPDDLGSDPDAAERVRMVRIRIYLRQRAIDDARREVGLLQFGQLSSENSAEIRRLTLAAHLAVIAGDPSAAVAVQTGIDQAALQDAGLWLGYLRLLRAMLGRDPELDAAIQAALDHDAAQLAFVAELIADRLGGLREQTYARLQAEVNLRPERWRDVLRHAVDTAPDKRSVRAGQLLEMVGQREDVARLRRLARALRQRGRMALGLELARRLADEVFVEDQGRVILRIGTRSILGTDLRRKVLALLCFLLSKAQRSATRDEVLEALWPDMEPVVALNSLNQTIYFLRRVFEPDYKEELSPGYVHHESDVVWLDPYLIQSRSVLCASLLTLVSRERTIENVRQLSDAYRGRFALDFAYEEWSSSYRDSMHASYLQLIESAISDAIDAGAYEDAIRLARRAIEVDPEAEELELSLLRLYRGYGAAAAAAEQYSHYAAMLREGLGVEPPPLDDL